MDTPAGSQREAFHTARALAGHLLEKKAGRLVTCTLDDCPCTRWKGEKLAVCAVYDEDIQSTFPIPNGADEVIGAVAWDDDGVASMTQSEIMVEDEHGDFEVLRIKLYTVRMQ